MLLKIDKKDIPKYINLNEKDSEIQYKIGITGMKDIDIVILSNLNDKDLSSACWTDKYISNLCKNDTLWKMKVYKSYPDHVCVKGITW